MTQLDLLGSPPPLLTPTALKSAAISPDGVYRYELRRELDAAIAACLVTIGLNPSTADAIEDDQTIRKDMGFARLWKCGRVIKGNGYGYRATDPDDMKAAAKNGIDIVGPDNDRYLREMCAIVKATSGILLVSWGKNMDPKRQVELAYLIDECDVQPMCLGTNKDGSPKHELYLKWTTPLVPWDCP